MPRQKKLAQAGRASTKHSLPVSPEVVLLRGRWCQSETTQQGWPGAGDRGRAQTGPRFIPASCGRSSGHGWPLGMGHGTGNSLSFPALWQWGENTLQTERQKKHPLWGNCMDVHQHSTTKVQPAGVACELSLVPHPSLSYYHRFSVKWVSSSEHTEVPSLLSHAQDGLSGIWWGVRWNPR